MPAGERREAIITATLPLLQAHGQSVSTRQIADAAGVAEGTIFHVFPDKEAVIRAAVERAFDPAPTEAALAAIDRARPFAEQLEEAVAIMQRRLVDVWRVVSTVGATSSPPPAPPRDLEALVDLFVPEEPNMRTDARTAARQLRALTLAVSHPLLIADEPMEPNEIVSLLLDGIRAKEWG